MNQSQADSLGADDVLHPRLPVITRADDGDGAPDLVLILRRREYAIIAIVVDATAPLMPSSPRRHRDDERMPMSRSSREVCRTVLTQTSRKRREYEVRRPAKSADRSR